MNTPVTAVIIVITLIVGSTLSVMNKACKSGHHAWCAPCPPYGIILKLSRRPDCDCRPEPWATVLARDAPCFIAHKHFAAIRRAKEIETLNVHSGTITKRPLTRGRFLMHFVRQADSAETLRAFYVTSSSIWPSFS